MIDLVVEPAGLAPVGQLSTEYVERKGLGHPDSICDAVMEAISVD